MSIDRRDGAAESGGNGHDDRYLLRLYVSGHMPCSLSALDRLSALCEQYLPGRYDLEVIDLCERPELARAAQVIAAPTLVKERPLPACRMIGDLSDMKRVLGKLNLGKSH
jgi:circadian clock protein KaiB